jgi:hypothetical protein
VKHRAVSNSQARHQLWGIQDSTNLGYREVADQTLIVALGWDGLDLPYLLQCRWHPGLDISHERLDRRESGVARRCTAAALLLNVEQKFEQHGGIDVLEAQLGWLLFQPFAGEREQQSEGVGVRLPGVGAETPFYWHVFPEKGRD